MPRSFGENWKSVAVLLLAIGKASAETLGFEPEIRPPRDVEPHLGSLILARADRARMTVDGKEYEIQGERLGRLRSLTGRGKAGVGSR